MFICIVIAIEELNTDVLLVHAPVGQGYRLQHRNASIVASRSFAAMNHSGRVLGPHFPLITTRSADLPILLDWLK